MLSRNALILSTISLTALAASPAFGQAATPVDQTPQKTQEGEANPPTSGPTNANGQPAAKTPQTATGGAIVITGSRIRRNNFTTPQNIDVYTRDDTILSGTRNTTETLQSATVTSGTAQISSSFLGFISDNGQGANVVGLRGLGSQRTLVLLNGRRLAPAGVGANLVAADLNVLPTSVVQRIEVLREGASSIYGSDAIAGVINVITDTTINGVTLDGFVDHPVEGKGDTIRGAITAGKTFSRGHILASLEYNYDKGLLLGDRNDWRCPRELAFVNGTEVGQTKVGSTQLRCFPFTRPVLGNPAGYFSVASFNGAPAGRLAFPGYNTGNPSLFGAPINVTNLNLRPEQKDIIYGTTVYSPIKTYSAYVNGAYDIDALGNAEIYGEGLFTRRKSWQQHPDRPDFLGDSTGASLPGAQLFGGTYTGPLTHGVTVPVSAFGLPVSPFFPDSFAAAGYNLATPFVEPDQLFHSSQKVDFARVNGGIRGDLGVGDWRYDANIQISRTKGQENIETNLTSEMANSAIAVLAPTGTPSQYITVGLPGQAGAGNSYTCQSNVTNGTYNGGNCVPFNFFDPNAIVFGRVDPRWIDYAYQNVVLSKTKYAQDTYSLDFDGSLLPLQGGDLKAAVGFQHRRDHINDQPGAERAAGLLYRYGKAETTVGSDAVNEGYLDVDAPFLKDKPFAHLLELEGSARYTHYESYGSSFTYQLNAQWAPVPELRFRGNYGTNFRAPDLYEQFVAKQIGFYGNGQDPCANFVGRYSPGTTVYNNCLAALTVAYGSQAGALTYNPPGGGFQAITQGGRDVVKAETAKTYGFGGVFTMPRRIADFTLAVDYWHVKVKGEINTLGNLILNFCYSATDYPNNPYCALIGPRFTPANAATPGAIGTITYLNNPYLNIAQQIASGIDFDARYATRFLGGRFSTQLQATRNLHQELQQFQGDTLNEYNGTLGYPGFGSGPKWVGSLDTRFVTANNITFHWGVKYVGKANSQAFANQLFLTTAGKVCKQGTAGCFPVQYDFTADPYWEHGVSVQWLWPTIGEFTIGMNNIFNEKPPVISNDNVNPYTRIGNYFADGPYDYRGRSVFVNVTRSFK